MRTVATLGRILGGVALTILLVASPAAARPRRLTLAPCALPSAAPIWIDYGDSLSPDVRDVFARAGVVVSSSGTAVPAYFRAHGAATTYFELHLPNVVGQPSDPADPSSIPAAASKLLSQATASTGCSTPWIALNELFGSNLPAPWSATNTVYRANVLALMQQLAAGGAHPVLLVHGDYTVAGATADWWRQVAQSGDIVYEAYYDATNITRLEPLVGNRLAAFDREAVRARGQARLGSLDRRQLLAQLLLAAFVELVLVEVGCEVGGIELVRRFAVVDR
jgi:hypothetical protein